MNTNFLNADASDFRATLRRPVIQSSVTLGSTGCQSVVFGGLPKSSSKNQGNESLITHH